jgi:fucose permease
LVPLYNIYNFATCPIEHTVEDGKGMSMGALFRTPMFWVAILLMVCSGASVLAMAQWASAFAESALGLSKTAGDLAGPCLFAITMGISRVIYGKWGEKIDLHGYMVASGILCLACYALASMTVQPVLGLVGCILCGFSVGIMWPGTISTSSCRMPLGGTAMFAILALAGDVGCSAGPTLVGFVSGAAGDNLKVGILAACIFPITILLCLGKGKLGKE